MIRMLAASIVGLSLSASTIAFADSSTEDAERLAGEGLAKILQALDLLIKTIPQYAAPEVQPNGDIIIRRLRPEQRLPNDPEEEEDEPGDGTET